MAKDIKTPPPKARKGGNYLTKKGIRADDFRNLSDVMHSIFDVQTHRCSGYIFDPPWKSDQDAGKVSRSDSTSRDLTAKFPTLRPWRVIGDPSDDYIVGVEAYCHHISGDVDWTAPDGTVVSTVAFSNTGTEDWASTSAVIAKDSTALNFLRAEITATNDGANVGEILQIQVHEFGVSTSQIPTTLFTIS